MEQLLQNFIALLKQLLVLLGVASQLAIQQPQIVNQIPIDATSTIATSMAQTSTSTPAIQSVATTTATTTAQAAPIPVQIYFVAPPVQPVQTPAPQPAPQPTTPIQTPAAESTVAPIPQKPMDYTINLKVFVNGVEATGQIFTGQTGEKFRITYQATSNAGEDLNFSVQNRGAARDGYDFESDQAGDQNVNVKATAIVSGTQTEKNIEFSLTAPTQQ